MKNEVRVAFTEETASFADRTGVPPGENRPWAPVKITKEQIDAEVERLASLPAPADGRRLSLLVHPDALSWAPGLAPGIQVALSVLKRHGDRVSRVALSSLEGQDQTVKRPARVDELLRQVDALLGADPAARAAIPALSALMRRVQTRRGSVRDVSLG